MHIDSRFPISSQHLDAAGNPYKTIDFSSAGNDQSGLIGTITWTNLKNSSYTDDKGVKHRIVKEVVTLSNGKSFGSTANKMLQSVNIFKDPVRFIVYNCDQFDTTTQYYDEQGNAIDFANTNAYISPMSLNGGRYDYMENGVEKNAGMGFEACQVLSGGTPYAIAGSSIKLHNGNDLYSDTDNQNKSYGSPYDLNEWDNTGSSKQYYGAGLIKLTGTKLSLRWHVVASDQLKVASRLKAKDGSGYIKPSDHPDRSISGPWAELTTVIPQNGELPKRQTTEIHYHYNTKKERVRYSLLIRCSLQESLEEFLKLIIKQK